MKRAEQLDIDDIRRACREVRPSHHLRSEFKIRELEGGIILGRQMLATNHEDKDAIAEYVGAAGKLYDDHITKMTKLTRINAKLQSPPTLPITFSAEETSELYWVLAQYGGLESVAAPIELGFKTNVSWLRYRLTRVPPEEQVVVAGMIDHLIEALGQWHDAARAAVHERCRVLDAMMAAETIKELENGVVQA